VYALRTISNKHILRDHSQKGKVVLQNRILRLCLLAVLCICLFSCGKVKKNKNQLVFGLDNDPKSLDPRLALDATGWRITEIVYSSLLKKDRNSNLVPDLAESWDMEGETVYVFHLRKNVKFHDGTPLTAEDVKYTFDTILEPSFKSPKRGVYEPLKSIEVLDDFTVRFTLKRPFAPFLTNMVMGIVSKSADELHPKSTAEKPLGSGPFRFVSWKRAQYITLAANADYYGDKPKVPLLKFKIVPDATVRILELETGEVDMLQNGVPPDLLDRLKSNKTLSVEEYTGSNYFYMGFNLLDPALKNRVVREAIAHAIDRKRIIHYLLKDMAVPAESLLPPSNWAFNAALKYVKHDQVLAKKLLAKAGYTNGKRLHLLMKTSQNEQSQKIAEILQQEFKEVGIDLDVRRFEWGTFFDDITKGNFQVYCLTWVGVTDPNIYHYIFHSSNIPPNGANRGHYKNPDMDRLLEKGRSTLDEGKRKDIYLEVQEILARDMPYVSLWYEKNLIVRKKRVKNFKPFPAGDFYPLTQVALE